MADGIKNAGAKGRALMWFIIFFLLFIVLLIYIYQRNFDALSLAG